MNRVLRKETGLLVALALCLTLAAVWISRRAPMGAPAPLAPGGLNAASPAAPASAFPLPRPAPSAASQRLVAKWKEKAEAKPDDARNWIGLGDALMQQARESADHDQYPQAEKVYRRALDLAPKSVEALTGMAWVASVNHDFPASVEWANKAIAFDPKNHAAYGLIGDAQVEQGDYDGAMDSYQTMLDIRPDISSYSRGANVLFLTGDTRKAMYLMAQAIKSGGPHAENTAWCRAELAGMLFKQGALPAAESVAKEGLAQTPNNYHLLAAMGKIAVAKKDYPSALDYYRKSLAAAPEHSTLVALGDLYALMGNKNEAEKHYALVEALHRHHQSHKIQDNMHMAQFWADHDRNLDEALRIAEAEGKDSKNAVDADTLAWAYYKNGRYQEARDAINRAMKLASPDASVLFHAGMIAAKRDAPESAKQLLYRALSLNSHFHPVHAVTAAAAIKELGSRPPGKTTAAR